MSKLDYYKQKAMHAKELFDKGLPFVKVYAPVRVGDKFMVLKSEKENVVKYNIAGGGVDEGETLEQALNRELKEELNVEVEIIKELGCFNNMYKTWELDGKKFDVQYQVHVFDTRLKKKLKGKFGLDGEFSKNINIVEVDKKTLIDNVSEFRDHGIKID